MTAHPYKVLSMDQVIRLLEMKRKMLRDLESEIDLLLNRKVQLQKEDKHERA